MRRVAETGGGETTRRKVGAEMRVRATRAKTGTAIVIMSKFGQGR
jgi:hypothetical protein